MNNQIVPNAQAAPIAPAANIVPNAQPNINQVRVRVPPFWKQDPDLWFIQLEAQFTTSNIVTDLTKYNTVVGNVESGILSRVSDILRNPPANNKYDTIKNRLINVFQTSDTKKLKTLLQDLTLGDSKPSDLLHKMRDLSCGIVGDELLQTIWLQRLPTNIQSVLACSEDNLDTLSTMADKIFETSENPSIQGISTPKQNNDLVNMIYDLKDKIEDLQKQVHESKPRNRSKQRNRRFSKNRNDGSKHQSPRRVTPHDTHCKYHKQYQHKAIRCEKPCTFHQDNKSKN